MIPSPTSQSVSQNTSRGSRPIKLRSACNQCCAAKVKCNGSRTGCDRCINIGAHCIYLESRVGKVPGIRSKKRHIQGDENGQPQVRGFVATQPSLPSATTVTSLPTPAANTASPIPDLLEPAHEQTWQWTTASQLDSSETHCDFLDPMPGNSSASGSSESMVTTSVTQDFVSNLDFDVEEMWTSPPSQRGSISAMPPPAQAILAAAPQQSVSKEALRARNEADSRCVAHCCQLINDLESYILADMEAFQIMLGIGRKALERLNELIAQQQGSRNLRCLMLFCTICYQVIELLHICCKTIAAPNNQKTVSMIASGGLGLGLAGFGYDEEEQSAWQAQRILKEINQGCEAVRKIKLLAGVGPDSTTAGATPEAAAREHCFEDIEHRFKDLSAKVKQNS